MRAAEDTRAYQFKMHPSTHQKLRVLAAEVGVTYPVEVVEALIEHADAAQVREHLASGKETR